LTGDRKASISRKPMRLKSPASGARQKNDDNLSGRSEEYGILSQNEDKTIYSQMSGEEYISLMTEIEKEKYNNNKLRVKY